MLNDLHWKASCQYILARKLKVLKLFQTKVEYERNDTRTAMQKNEESRNRRLWKKYKPEIREKLKKEGK